MYGSLVCAANVLSLSSLKSFACTLHPSGSLRSIIFIDC